MNHHTLLFKLILNIGFIHKLLCILLVYLQVRQLPKVLFNLIEHFELKCNKLSLIRQFEPLDIEFS